MMFVVAPQQLAVGGEEVGTVQQIGPPIRIETQGGASKQDRRLRSIGHGNELQLIDRLTLKDERCCRFRPDHQIGGTAELFCQPVKACESFLSIGGIPLHRLIDIRLHHSHADGRSGNI